MRESKHCFIPGILLCSMVILVGCNSGYQGSAFERKPDNSIGPTIAGVEIAFSGEDGSSTRSVTTNSAGHYRITLIPQRYVLTATHPDYFDYSTAPAFLVVTGEGYQTLNIFMKKRSVDLLMITTSLLEKEPDFEDTVSEYKSVLVETDGLSAAYIELDSDECLVAYGVKVNNPGDWEEVRNVLQEIVGITEASYIMILGGPLVVPRPVTDALSTREEDPVVTVPSDAWYLDFDNDKIVDEGLCISRLPDLSYNSSAVVDALQTAIELHNVGGYTLDNEVRFTMYDYTTPPYGVCYDCEQRDAFFVLMSTRDYIYFYGHGSPTAIYSVDDYLLTFSIDYIDMINLQCYHPVIFAAGPCYAGVLKANNSTLSYEFIKAGAAAYVAKSTGDGISYYILDNFPSDIEGGMRIGPALFQSMRQTVLDGGDRLQAIGGHFCLYGDPTLRRRNKVTDCGVVSNALRDRSSFVEATRCLFLIDFDTDPYGNSISAPSPGVLAGNLCSAFGVTFSAGVVFGEPHLPFKGVSPPNTISNSAINTPTPALIDGTFASPVCAVGITNVSAEAILRIYDVDNNLISSITSDTDPNTKDFIGLTSSVPIHRFEFDFVSGIGFGGDDLLFGMSY